MTGQPLDRLLECLEFLHFDEGPLPGQAHTRPEFGERGASRGYIVAPPSSSYGYVKVIKHYSPVA